MRNWIFCLIVILSSLSLFSQESVALKRYQNLFPHFLVTGNLQTPLQKAIVISQRPCDTLVFFIESKNRLKNMYCTVNDTSRVLTESISKSGIWVYSLLMIQNPMYCPFIVAQWNCDSAQKVNVMLLQSPGDSVKLINYMQLMKNEGMKALSANYITEKWQTCQLVDFENSIENKAPFKIEVPKGEWLLHITVVKPCRDRRIQVTGLKEASDRYVGEVDSYSEVPEATGEFTTVFLVARVIMNEPGFYYFLVDEFAGSSVFCPYEVKVFRKPL